MYAADIHRDTYDTLRTLDTYAAVLPTHLHLPIPEPGLVLHLSVYCLPVR